MRSVDVEIRTEVSAPASAVWAHATTMAGVNEELAPWVRMTHPAEISDLATAPPELLGGVAFRSWLLAFGYVPFDRHSLRLLSVDDRGPDGGAFVEDSTSWLQKRWRHERTVDAVTDTRCAVTDHLVVEPRVGLARPLVARLVPWLFARRHRTLVARFGAPVEVSHASTRTGTLAALPDHGVAADEVVDALALDRTDRTSGEIPDR